MCLFRIVQEALHNIVKHSGSASATVRIIPTPSGMRLRIADRGKGFNTTMRDGAGLGLLTLLLGFETFYTVIEPSLAVVALMAAVEVAVALAVSYLAALQHGSGRDEAAS